MPLRLVVPDDVLTAYLSSAAARVGAEGTPTTVVADPDPAEHAADAVLARTGDLAVWEATHRVAPDAGVATVGPVAVVLTTPVRADIIDEPIVWLRELSTTARLLARATVERYYGTAVRGWSETGDGAQAVLVEGPDALAPLETGFRDDLGRAWFILNGVPLVSHLLLVPTDAGPADVEAATRWVQEVGGLDKERRKKARDRLAARAGIPPSDVVDLLAAVRTTLEPADVTAAKLLFQLARDPAFPTPRLATYGPDDAQLSADVGLPDAPTPDAPTVGSAQPLSDQDADDDWWPSAPTTPVTLT